MAPAVKPSDDSDHGLLGPKGKQVRKHLKPVGSIYMAIQAIADFLHFGESAKEVGKLILRILQDIASVLVIWYLMMFVTVIVTVGIGSLVEKLTNKRFV